MSVNYNPVTPTEGLVLCIDPSNPRCYPGSGTTVFDLSGQGNNGTLTNGASVVNTGGGRALDFDGTDDYVQNSVKFYGIGAIAFWVKTATEIGAAVSFGTTASSGNLMLVALGQNIAGSLNDELITVATLATSARIEGYTTANRNELLDNKWHHVCISQPASNASYEIYLDGSKKTTTVGDASLTTFGIGSATGDVMQFGSRRFNATQGAYLNGQLDDIRLYSRALSESEIRLLFESKRGKYL